MNKKPNPVLRVAKWADTFEISESRRIKNLKWVAIPLARHSNGYSKMIEEFEDDAPAIYGAWIVLVQIAAQCSQRGLLCTSKGIGYTAGRLSLLSHFPSSVFERLIDWCVLPSIGWLEIITEKDAQKCLSGPDPERENSTSSGRPAVTQQTAGLHNTTPHNMTRHNTTPPDTTGQDDNDRRSVAVLEFDFECSWGEIKEKAARFRKMINLPASAVPTATVVDVIMFDEALGPGHSFAADLAICLRNNDIKNPKRYIAGAFRRACNEVGQNWSDVQPLVAGHVQKIKATSE